MIAKMLYASSRLELAHRLQAYLLEREESLDPTAMTLVVQAIAYVPPGRSSAEGAQQPAPLGLMVVTDMIPKE